MLVRLAAAYHVVISISRDTPDVKVTAAFRKVALKAHPDKGGKSGDFQELQQAREKWETAKKNKPPKVRTWSLRVC